MRHTIVAVFIALCGAAVSAQNYPPTEFEVASVKPSPPEPPKVNIGSLHLPPPGQWSALRVTLTQLIAVAYPAYGYEGLVVGGPSWIHETKFDVDARMDPKTTPVQMVPMMAHLLAVRFALRSHTEQRPAEVYVLKLARGDGRLGPGLKRSSATCIEAKTAQQPPPQECRRISGPGLNLPVSRIADFLQFLSFQRVDRPVIDRTALTGYFDFRVTYDCGPFAPMDERFGPRPCGADSVSLFTALQEQAGLKLEPARETVDVLVIDSAKMPEPD